MTSLEEQCRVDGNTSDGYHTFNELYEHRHTMFSIICREYGGWKSRLHSDGTMMDGWFIAGVETPQGQATYHLPLVWWDRFTCREIDKAPEWDGHTPDDVLKRMASLSSRDQQWREAVEEMDIKTVSLGDSTLDHAWGHGYNAASDELNRQKAKILESMADQSGLHTKGVKYTTT